MRYFRYIFLTLFITLLAVSCIEELESPIQPASDVVTLVPRVTSFANQYVTRAGEDEIAQQERKISKLSILVFDNSGNLVHIAKEVSSTESVILNTSMLKKHELSSATIVMFANVSLSDIKKPVEGKTDQFTSIEDDKDNLELSDLSDYSFHFTDEKAIITEFGETFTGLPMMGISEGVNLTTTSTSAVEVSLKILYAKIKFSIKVANGTENTGTGMQFTLNSYSVYNASNVTSISEPTGATVSSDYTTAAKSVTLTQDNLAVLNGSSLNFTFYVSESRYNHNLTSLAGIYPSNDWLTSSVEEDVKGYGSLSSDAKLLPENQLNGVKYFYDDLIQQYKPKLADVDNALPAKGAATYVIINGTYKDYRGTDWNVNYKVYLGKDNAQNFHVDRNSEYLNNLTIKGIRNNDSYKEYDEDGNLVDQHVWIDHRVNVSTTDISKHVTITRETLIDAHIEVRPLRINLAGSNYQRAAIYLPKYPDGNNWKQLDEIMGGANENWIAIENNNGSTNKGRLYSSNGKRRYFTTSLIEELHSQSASVNIDSEGNKYINLVDGDCAWLYFDENASSATRRARIDVVFYPSSGSAVTESYYVYQSGYAESGGQKFENYEEYLHSYDSSDNYGLTTSPTDYTQKGLEWGYKGTVFSKNNIVSQADIGLVLGNTTANLPYIQDLRYDYFSGTDLSSTSMGYIYSANTSWDALTDAQKQNETGLYFTDRATQNAPTPITIMDLNTRPGSAYQYCLSKNKFKEDADGNHTLDIHWYLPDVNELESVFKANHADADLYVDAYYWSSQPSYSDLLGGTIIDAIESVLGDTKIIDEDANNARAVSKTSTDNIARDQQNRIRCFYSSTGIDGVNMKDRVPSGLGGVIKIPMTVKDMGYFNYPSWLKEIENEDPDYPESSPRYPMNDSYPKGSNDRTEADTDFSALYYNNVHYYAKNPLSEKTWDSYNISSFGLSGYYTLIHETKWPGLTEFEVENVSGKTLETIASWIGISAVCELTETPKTNEKAFITRSGKRIDAMPSQITEVPLDHNEPGVNVLNISFNKGTNSTAPKYQYYNEDPSKTTKTVFKKTWQVPTYSSTNYSGPDEPFTTSSHTLATRYTLLLAERELMENDLKNDGYTIRSTTERSTGSGLSKKYYYEIIAYRNIPIYRLNTPGSWVNEQKGEPEPYSANPSVDRLELFGGNEFTISAIPGYRIRSIKVNFSDDNAVKNITGDLFDVSYRNLRLVDGRQTLPTTAAPDYMSYSGDGQTGWFQWTAPTVVEYASSVTLKLVAYVPAEGTNVFRPTSFQYADPTKADLYQSDLETSIVIDSFEIRIEEVEEPSTDE